MDIQLLEEKYLKAKEAYYSGEPIMEDWEFDELEQILKDNFSEVINIVGADNDTTAKAEHWNPMLSLAKKSATIDGIIPFEEFQSWINSRLSTLNKKEYTLTLMPKYDGNSVNLQYKNGNFFKAITRGNGIKGTDITEKVKYIIPLTIPYKEDVEIRGEVILNETSYNKWKKTETKNPRNFVAGILGRDEHNEELLKDLTLFAFSLRGASSLNKYFDNDDQLLTEWGFNKNRAIPFSYLTNSYTDFNKEFNNFLELRKTYEYKMDGFVVKLDLKEEKEILGENSHDPEYAIAIKFPPEGALTQIESISWNLGNYGELVPIANLSPTELDGTTVKRASLFSWGNLNKKGCFPGAKVKIAKAGDIIPNIYEVIIPSEVPIEIPTNCPSCNTVLYRDEIHIECRNEFCEAQLQRRFGSCMNVLGYQWFGPSIMESFWKAGFRTTLDFFDKEKMNKQNLIYSKLFVEGRMLDRLFDEMSKMMEIDFWKLIISFKLKGLGRSGSKEIAKFLSGQKYSFENLERAPLEKFLNPDYIGRKNVELLIQLVESNNITILFPSTTGIAVELTGSPKSFGYNTKEDFLEVIKEHGFIHGGLKEAMYLITDDLNSSTSKMKTANKKGIKIFNYQTFLEDVCNIKNTNENDLF
jgi:DNA ligase (NAD+)